MLTTRQWIYLGVAVALLSGLVISFYGEPKYEVCETPNDYETICQNYHIVPYFSIKIVRLTDRHEGFFSLLTGAAVALFTFCLVVLGRNADRHFRVSERAYVKISPFEPGVKWDGPEAGGFTTTLRVKNFGETPAIVTDVISNAFASPKDMIFDEAPPTVRHDFPQETKAFLVKGDEFFQHPHTEIDDAERAEVEAGGKFLIVYGYVYYIDKFGVRHRGGFGRRYLPSATTNNLIFPDTGPFNYDRVRKPGE